MQGDRYYLEGGYWQRRGALSVKPAQPAAGPVLTPRTHPFYGACPTNGNGNGATSAAATSVLTKWGTGASIRQFFGTLGLTVGPFHPAGASVVHSDWKPPDADVNSGALDQQLIDMINRTPDGDIIELWHESDAGGVNGLNGNAAGRAARIAAKNRLYDLKQQTKPGVLVAHTFTGGLFANWSTDATRRLWDDCRGDLLGIDLDGVFDYTGPAYEKTDWIAAQAVANAKAFIARNAANGWKGWTVPEFGTAKADWDTDGTVFKQWLTDQAAALDGAYAVMYYDYNALAANNTATQHEAIYSSDPAFPVWKSLVASNQV